MPKAAWSIWARVGQSIARRGPAAQNLWTLLGPRLVGHNAAAGGMYSLLLAAMQARAESHASDDAA
jgi:hypothetical protein